jgi:hypothetical protein
MIARTLLAVSILFYAAQAIAQSPPHPLLTPERIAELEKGEVVVVKVKHEEGKDNAAASAAAFVLISKPPQTVWDTLTQFEQQAEYMPRLNKVSRYDIDPSVVGLKQELKVVWKTVIYYLKMKLDNTNHRMDWTLDPDKESGIESTDGYWAFKPWGEGKTLAIYELNIDTGMAVPKFIAQALLNSDLPGVLEALKQRVESGGTWKKD